MLVGVIFGSADMSNEVPSNTLAFATAYLNPSASQKLNLLSLAEKFPGVTSQSTATSTLNTYINQAFHGSGLNYTKDVQPWLGGTIAVYVTPSSSATNPNVGVLIASTNATEAQAAITKLLKSGGTYTKVTYNGVTVYQESGTDIAYVDNTVVVGTTAATVDAVIDTTSGKTTSLASNSTFSQTVSHLPSGRLAYAYAAIPGLVNYFAAVGNSTSSISSASLTQLQSQLSGFEGFGISLSAESNGLETDSWLQVTQSKLSPAENAALNLSPHVNSLVAGVPSNAAAVLGYEGVGTVLSNIGPALAPYAASVPGLSGLVTTLSKELNGDMVAYLQPGSGQIPSGAAIFQSSESSAAMHAINGYVGSLQISATSAGSAEGASLYNLGSGGTNIAAEGDPSGDYIVGTSTSAVKAAIASLHGGTGIASTTYFQEATGGNPNSLYLIYVNIPVAYRLISLADPSGVPSTESAYMTPLKAYAVYATSNYSYRTFLVIS